MISSFALVLMGAMAATPCENLKTVELKQATITAADFVPEGPAPARGGGGGGARGAEAALRVALRPQLRPRRLNRRRRSRRIAAFRWFSSRHPTP